MQIYDFCTLELLIYLMVPDWNSESSKLIPLFLVLTLVVLYLDLIWSQVPLRLKILSIDLIMLLTILF
jgi:hypothetical protein